MKKVSTVAARQRKTFSGNQSYGQLAKLVGVTPRGNLNANGRQADRRKIARAPEEIIRKKVISEPLISDEEFQSVQKIMDLKQTRHWRTQPDLERRFTYNGFLTCAVCGQIIHTALARRDYYACKGRRTEHVCSTKYMAREKLEERLDSMFAEQLTSPAFLENCFEQLSSRRHQDDSALRIQRLTAEANSLREKRN
jgi:hypothetical protein